MSEIEEFKDYIENLYGLYRDTIEAYSQLIPYLEKNKQLVDDNIIKITRFKFAGPSTEGLSPKDRESTTFIYTRPYKKIKSRSSYNEIIERNKSEGANPRYLKNMILASIYIRWDEDCRKRLETRYKLEKNGVRSDLFHDLGILRHSIVKNNGIRSSHSNKNFLVLNEIEVGEIIDYSEDDFEEIIDLVVEELESMNKIYK
jgi:hypothetical protein